MGDDGCQSDSLCRELCNDPCNDRLSANVLRKPLVTLLPGDIVLPGENILAGDGARVLPADTDEL